MKIHFLIPWIALLALTACERKETPAEKVEDKDNDALDRRPAEKIRDAAEDVEDAVKDNTN